MSSPIVSVTIQSTVLAAISNLVAQGLTSYQTQTPFVLDWVPLVQFMVFTLINAPPNFLWQEFLETTFPAHGKPAKSTKKTPAKPAEPKLNITNTAIKFLLDQTIGSLVNTFAFGLFVYSMQEAMARPEAYAGPAKSADFLLSGEALDFSRVDWTAVFDRVRAELFPLVVAGWRLWPIVSIINFAFIKSVQGRALVGGLAGLGWGVYMSLFAAGTA